jgi:hypothetical protein
MGTPYPIQNGYQLPYTKWALKPIQYITPTLMVPPELPPQVLCQLEEPHQLGALQVQGEADQSSFAPATAASMDQVLPLCRYTHTLLQDLLILDVGPHGLWYTLQHPLKMMDAGPLPSPRPLPVAHVLVQHQHHLVSTSSPPSALLAVVALVLDG